ncbi:uncharacterized protein PHALS_15175 [Plasmopara halstedii]|uniref:Uncharacterized protein n=1 Tax=Plasmopara halstedii TaxID=4781 RepID=A0A0N7L838_PLAHL|nr:uncharacterized protein PHALS_15175 [Plasmopara halstedii]CEG48795.1 hypothetical protein PHALS_15175 [Plasmopara halstedii]|eukprot:XP_024585164.1 hypothetical protein PHALS_15175 [Plasmopara halstedii]
MRFVVIDKSSPSIYLPCKTKIFSGIIDRLLKFSYFHENSSARLNRIQKSVSWQFGTMLRLVKRILAPGIDRWKGLMNYFNCESNSAVLTTEQVWN